MLPEKKWKKIYKYLKVGIIHSQAYPQTFKSDEDFVWSMKKIVLDSYFNTIEFHSPKDKIIRKECIKILHDSDMYRVYMGTVEFIKAGANMFSLDKTIREHAFALSCRLIDDALEWEADEIMFSNAPDPGEEKRKDAYKYLEEYFVRLSEYIDKNGKIRLTMEVIDRNPLAKNYLCGSTYEAKQLWDNVRKSNQNFGLVIDLSHLPLLGEKPTDTIRIAGESFVHGHIGTCVMDPKSNLCGDMHPSFHVQGSENGVDDIVEFIKAGLNTKAISKKFPMPISMEVRPYGSQTTEDVVEYAKDVLSMALEKITEIADI